MDVETEVYALAQRVAALEAGARTNSLDINKLGDSVRDEIEEKVDKGVAPKVDTLEKGMFKVQIYIAAVIGVVGIIATLVQYIITIFGISLSDISIKGK